ncbi:S9 family peptidase [Mariniblastus fucicola]|uniref:Prolyl tripeptidyl peptidase n=1 Tax=Mariniblastus fucicola TaxID=980251 RepID=A0A5B9PLB4_9BACT|nr:prolyl oligopeptidase family serine peptidase [Mariniblastus fucicola]QEG23133.1 Prolyl tripeptidyl peptidase precursor [Mariniblastus fucicola]
MRTVFLLLIILMSSPVAADETWQLPPQEVVDIIDAKPEPIVSFSPDSSWMLFLHLDAMPDIADIARRRLRLAGLRIDPQANARFQNSWYRGISLRKTDSKSDDTGKQLIQGDDAKIGWIRWSHDSKKFLFTQITDSGTALYVCLVESGEIRQLHDNLSTVMQSPQWMPDAKHVLLLAVPESRGAEPKPPVAPAGPSIQESAGNTSPTRTYQDLLKTPYDERLFEYYASNELIVVDLDGTVVKKFAAPDIYFGVNPSPDGKHLLVQRLQKPFSYLLTWRSFPHKVTVTDLDGNEQYLVADVPMEENIPIEGVRLGRRRIDWMSKRDATLIWGEALDGGDPNVEAPFRDQVSMLAAPFDAEPTPVIKTEHRWFGADFFSDANRVAMTEYDRDRRWVRTLLHDLSQPDVTPLTLVDRSVRDRYGDPGRLVQVPDETGHYVALQNGDDVFRFGNGASPKGNLPFVDSQSLSSLETKRLWRCEEGALEAPVRISGFADDDSGKAAVPILITDYEDTTSPSNYRRRDLSTDSYEPLTEFRDPTPQIRSIKKQLVTYKRKDGVPLSATLYLPGDYKEGTKLPLLVWAYPQEFNDPSTAGQVSGSDARFTRMRGITHLTFLTQGYAVMDAATMPIVGDPETMNDTFIEQIVDSAQAAIDKAVEMGVADRNRVGVGGHSYGAFMTANLMAHCDLFKAGIARSGAYNRTLTPFGFQSERRSYWDAKDIYHSISPFMHADKINEPLLLIHGDSDNNSGTFPIQSQRLYQAIKGNGGTVRLVMLPHESHGYRARQSVLQTQAEMIRWFAKHVKGE